MLAVTAAAFAVTLTFGFSYDDVPVIVDNDTLLAPGALARAFTTNVWAFAPDLAEPRYYRPLFTAWTIGNAHLFGTDPMGWHATTVVLHLGAVWILWELIRAVSGSTLAATTGALLFAIHPTRAESVAWVCGLTDPMAAAAGFGAVLAYVKERRLLAVALYAVALLTKETAIIFGAFPVLLAWSRKHWREGWTTGGLWGGVAGGYRGGRSRVIGEVAPTLQANDPGVVVDLVGGYTKHLLFPWTQALSYPVEPAANYALLGVAIFAAGALTSGPARPFFWMGGLFLLPVLNVAVLQPDMMLQDRYLYLPSACWFAALGWGAAQAARRPGKGARAAATVGIVAAAYVAILSSNLPPWESNRTLWERAVEVNPTSGRVWFNLGTEHENAGDLRMAEAHYARAVDLEPRRAIFHYRLAFMLAERQQLHDAARHFRKAADLRPEDASMRYEADRIEAFLKEREERD